MRRLQLTICLFVLILFGFGVQAQAPQPTVQFGNEFIRFMPYSYYSNYSILNTGTLSEPVYTVNGSSYATTCCGFPSTPLQHVIGVGGDGTNEFNLNGMIIENPFINGPYTIDQSNVTLSPNGYSYGTVTYSGFVNIGGYDFLIENVYELGQMDRIVRVTTKFTNLSQTTVTNFRYWTGNRDDYLNNSDGPYEQRGNLINGTFQQIPNAASQAKAIMVSSGSHRALLYSWDVRTQSSIYSCCSLPYNQNPFTNDIARGGDGSYTLFVRLNDLAQGESDSFTWYFGASDTDLFNHLLYDNNELAMADITINSATLLATSYQTGDGYYIVVPRGSDAPTAQQVKAGVDYGTVSVLANGQGAITAGNEQSYPIMGLTPDFDYDVYFVVESGSVFTSVDKIEFTTLTCEGPQIDALKALYETLNGDEWAWTDPSKSWKDSNGNWRRFNNNGVNWEGVVMNDCDILSIDLSGKTLSGYLPNNIGDLTALSSLKLGGNNIIGKIPESIKNLNLTEFTIGYNGVYTDDPSVKAFIDQFDPGWDLTQSLPPVGLMAQLLNPSAVISWTPIVYQGGTGRYFIKYRAEDEGGFKTITVEGKNSSEGTIPNLEYGKKYLVYVQTQTDANPPFNPNAVTSDLGEVIELFFATPIAQTEREALIALYEAMGGDEWTNNAEWKDPTNFSPSGTEILWQGVTVSKVNNVWTVTGIDLSNNNLQGELPDVFGAFPNLTSLNLAGNCIEGAVPTSLANLSNLESLDLSRNRFNSFTLTSLSATNVNVSYNALGQGDDNTALLESKQADYLSTQTIAPSPLTIETDATTASISWSAIGYTAGEGHYEVRLRRTGSTSWSTRTTENKGQSSVSYNDLMGSTEYEVQIRTLSIDAEADCYTFSRWSESTTFSTLQPLPVRANLSSPADYAINTATALNLVVAATAHADSYEIQLSTSRDFNEGSTTSYSTTTGSQAIEGLNTNERYYWRARGVNTRGNGPWSQTSQFRTGLSQSVSIIEGQSTCLAEGAQTFSWNAVAGASHYRIEIATDANFSNVIRRATALQTTQLTVFDLNPNETYFWRVQAYNDVSGFIGNWSATGQISIQPRIQITGELELCAGSSTTLSLNSEGAIQWYRNGTAIAGATASSYTATTAGTYYAIIEDETSTNCASYQTETVAITQAEQTTPTITASSTQVCEGETTTLSTPATGTAYQWYRNGAAIAGATATSYSTAEAGTYTVEVSINNSCSSISAGITIQRIALPQDQSISITGSMDLCGTEEGTTLSLNTDQLEGLSIQWYRDGTAIANATATSYTATEAGEYTAQISNGTCSTTTEAITLTGTVLPIPTITLTELGQTQLRLGMPVALRASTAPTGTRYVWYRDGEELVGLNSAMILATQNGDYQVAIESSTGCSTISEEYLLTWPEGREPRDQQTRAIDARDLSGIAQEIRDGWIMAFPNPTESMITISVSADKLSNSTVEVRVTDFLGRTVYSGNMQQAGDRYESSFNMGNLRRGLYYIHVEDGTVSYRKTVKKE